MLVTGLGFSQKDAKASLKNDKEKLTSEQRVEKRVAKLTTELGLNATQQKQISEVFLAKAKEKEAKKAEYKAKKAANDAAASKKEFSEADKAKFKAERQAKMEAHDAKMKSILTAEQYTKWKAGLKEKSGKKGDKSKKWKKQ